MRNYPVEHFAAHLPVRILPLPRPHHRLEGPAGRTQSRLHGFVAPYLTDIDNQCATAQAVEDTRPSG